MEGDTESCTAGWVHAQYIFIPIFCWWVELGSLLAIYLRPNYGAGTEDNGDLPENIPKDLIAILTFKVQEILIKYFKQVRCYINN